MLLSAEPASSCWSSPLWAGMDPERHRGALNTKAREPCPVDLTPGWAEVLVLSQHGPAKSLSCLSVKQARGGDDPLQSRGEAGEGCGEMV